ncbi:MULTISPECIES: thiol:disulfide interchange protein DsbA/DsbL [Nitrosomonas]|uniref:Thiol:disulfide interchange protein n=1 Tax=Nitrosomonas communis TaxID=44574 RepID=A0A0F7KI87_9PROT|nr:MULTISPECIES: thiol:disulfide interchange protein DsbA/DsbL [Nitrosomonas]AKH38823.1 DSBA oxidoreductase [Nitrosomonas communis]TYP88794.1 thiol:disulfide interchange protein DsbA [Nitrosomonas communis]UVS60935.1 thiol:disulfide interchange protein DsbA/DsbL [Nitrosomonas sp. PLL12]
MNKLFKFFLVFITLNLSGILFAQAEIIEGRDYIVLATPQPTEDQRSIEVIEFFWYGCPHCYELHPHIDNWRKNAPKDVKFRYVPAIFRANWTPAAKTFYAMEALGITKELHDKVYKAIHRDKIDLSKEAVLFDRIEKQGIERAKFINAYNSFSVQNQVAKVSQMIRQYKLTGVPALVVEGKYITSGKMSGTPRDTIQVLNELIDKARKERASN